LDGDGNEELILYDRQANMYQIFKIEGDNFIPASELSVLLPEINQSFIN